MKIVREKIDNVESKLPEMKLLLKSVKRIKRVKHRDNKNGQIRKRRDALANELTTLAHLSRGKTKRENRRKKR